MKPYRDHSTTSQDGLRLYWRDYPGDAARTPLLCLPGLTRNSRDFSGIAQRYLGSRRILCPDYRGRGRSDYDPNPANYRPETYLNDLRHILAAAGVHRVVVLGTSMGGLLAMGMGVMLPRLLAGVMLNDVGPDVHPSGLGRIITYIGRDHPMPDWPSAAAFLRQVFPGLAHRDDATMLGVAHGTYRPGEDGLLHYDWDVRLAEPLVRNQVPDLWPYFRSLAAVPVLALRGQTSDILTAETFNRMGREKPDLIRVEVPGVGHTPCLDEPESVAALDGFLARL